VVVVVVVARSSLLLGASMKLLLYKYSCISSSEHKLCSRHSLTRFLEPKCPMSSDGCDFVVAGVVVEVVRVDVVVDRLFWTIPF